MKSGMVAMLLMMLIYGLIAYMGASSVASIGSYDNGGLVFAAVAQHYFGSYGNILLAVIIVLACLKTSIGLITACSEFFHGVFPKISYKWFVLILCLSSFAIANFGLTNIIQFAIPVLMLLYPIAIILIFLTLCSSFFRHKQSVYATTIFLTFCVSFFDGYNSLVASLPGASLALFESVKLFYMNYLPLYEIGLGWITPAIAGVVIGLCWPKNTKKAAVS